MKKLPRNLLPVNRFAPSKFSGEGFTGNDKRSVDEIIAADGMVLESFGVTSGRLAHLLTELFDKAEIVSGDTVIVADGVEAVHFEARGKLPCPFRCSGAFLKGEVAVSEVPGGRTAILTRLGIHLIGQHGFFEGVGSRYRLDPEFAVAIGTCIDRKND